MTRTGQRVTDLERQAAGQAAEVRHVDFGREVLTLDGLSLIVAAAWEDGYRHGGGLASPAAAAPRRRRHLHLAGTP